MPKNATMVVILVLTLLFPKYLSGAENEFASICDDVFQDDQKLEKYCQEKNIPY